MTIQETMRERVRSAINKTFDIHRATARECGFSCAGERRACSSLRWSTSKTKPARRWIWTSCLYRQLGMPEGYVHAHGFDSIRQEAMVMEYVTAHGLITRKDAVKLCTLNERQAGYLLRRLATKGKLRKVGEKRGSYYKLSD